MMPVVGLLSDHSRSHPPLPIVTRAVVRGQLLFTAGNALTTGGFLYYFAYAFEPTALEFALLLALPELCEAAGLLARPVIEWFGSRKRTWVVCFVAARLCALGVPLMAYPVLAGGEPWPFSVLVGWVAAWYVLQGLAYVAYISWLSDLVPEGRWGHLFARRKMAELLIRLLVPVTAAMLREHWAKRLPDDVQLITYGGVFAFGSLLLFASIVPLIWLPDVPVRRLAAGITPRFTATLSVVRAAFADRSFRLLLFHSWWLSFAQGLTQAAFYGFRIRELGISLEMFYVLNGVMLTLQLPMTWAGGELSDRSGDKWPLFWGVTCVSGAMLFWLAATPDQWWWLFGAQAAWGLFGVVNICGRNLTLKLAPRSDNMTHFALFRQIGGVFTAAAGLLGGLWLDHLLQGDTRIVIGGWSLGGYQILFVVSLLGRATAGLWLLPIREPARAGR